MSNEPRPPKFSLANFQKAKVAVTPVAPPRVEPNPAEQLEDSPPHRSISTPQNQAPTEPSQHSIIQPPPFRKERTVSVRAPGAGLEKEHWDELAQKIREFEVPTPNRAYPIRVSNEIYSRLKSFGIVRRLPVARLLTCILHSQIPPPSLGFSQLVGFTPSHNQKIVDTWSCKPALERTRSRAVGNTSVLFYETDYLATAFKEAESHRISKIQLVENIVQSVFPAATLVFEPKRQSRRQ